MDNMSWIIIWLLLTTVLGSVGSILFKLAMDKMTTMSAKGVLTNKWVWFGFFFYLLSSYTNVQLYKYLSYDVAYPLTAITYIWTILLSYFIFKEKITINKVIAIVGIIVGVTLISI